ncbi:homoserine O-acetyltransferase MetX [Jiangella gansuensis]|uniref:homoserine O-acetyltransferase MetX n=1 Tax=Jiangella gansuensis TaxID=281473 RepID=UPI00047D8385|nr:homoserine O-acetyltransferase [Jiangella gansuensis]
MTEQAVGDPAASGAWDEGDPLGNRRFADAGDLRLESGTTLPGVRVAYETWGTLAPDASNAVLVLHALTGDSHVAGPAGPGHPTPGWWDELVGPGRAIDTDRYFVVAPNVLGGCQGTTGPSSRAPDGRRWAGRFPRITVRDQVAAEALLADVLRVDTWAAVVGGSMGGMRALEWAVTHPDRVSGLLLAATCAAASAEQIGLCSAQAHAVRADARFRGGDYYDAGPGGGPSAGLGVARRIAHLSYRSEPELQARFGRLPQDGEDPAAGGRFAVESYLDHQAAKLVRRFDANSYIVLSEAMNTHDVGRGRGGIPAALARVSAETVVVGIDSDRLYPLWQQQELATAIPRSGEVRVVNSPYGHDGFLIETAAVAKQLAELLRD